ncbi:hypothetical protein AB0K09_15785 [Streptomyces sp. NPDC049577]|uniref:hypothetical protein n=1 Tax=Streptomyces sp. NPDC049577 TaxID=3155153 RepID=UPI00343543E8
MPSPVVKFRAVPPLDALIEARRAHPDTRSNPLAGGPSEPHGYVNPGTVAARDLYAYYQLTAAELAEAAEQLTRRQVLMVVEAVRGLALDFRWIVQAPQLLAAEIADAYADDEDGPGKERRELAEIVAGWPRLRALAVVEAAVSLRLAGHDLDEALRRVGLLPAAEEGAHA